MITGRFTDHHVHLQLVDHTLLAGSRLGRVIDLGANPEWVREISCHNSGDPGVAGRETAVSRREADSSPELWRPKVEYAGAFLTAPGGYPSDRAWAPAGSVREIPDAATAATTVAELAALGVSRIKTTLHSDAGPVFDDETFRAVVTAAHAHRLPVVAHTEGAGQAQRAARLGADRLAHAPFSERLSDDEIAAQAASVEWISTLAIHDEPHRAIAVDNVNRFAQAGGTVLYGTDMGNGDLPIDLNPAELDALREAGITGARLIQALAPTGPDALFLPDGDPAAARPLTPADLEA